MSKQPFPHLHITAATFALRLRNTRLTATSVDLAGIVKLILIAAEALSSKVYATVRIASFATPARAVRWSHGDGAELGGRQDADAAVIVATQGRERGIEACRSRIGTLERFIGVGKSRDHQ